MSDNTTAPMSPRLPGYEVIRPIGRGGMGTVWLAHEQALDRSVAIKLLHSGGSGTNTILREARAAAKLNHPNILVIYQFGSQPDGAFVAMEYLEAGSLADELRRDGAMTWQTASRAIRDAAMGLGAAHRAGVVHRDIKPSNLMRGSDGLVKVVDFGLAKSNDAAVTATPLGTISGTPGYLAPEQCLGQPADARSDVYALTCTYYQLLTGRLPFAGDSVTAILYQHCHTPFPEAPGIPREALRILKRGSQKNPEDRYQSADEFLKDVEALLGSSRSSAPPVELSTGPFRSHRLRALVLVATAMLLIAIGAGWAFRKALPRPFAGENGVELSVRKPAVSAARLPPNGPMTFTNTVGMKFTRIEPGEFLMGSPIDETGRSAEAETQHKVRLTRPFYLGTFLVTRGQFAVFVRGVSYQTDAEKVGSAFSMDAADKWGPIKGASWRKPGYDQTDDYPVVTVSWNDTQAFCNWLSRKEGKNYRLPTEAEWEYACRAGTHTAYFWGDNPNGGAGFANCGDLTGSDRFHWSWAFQWRDGFVFASPVGSFKPNPWGLYDMTGNVMEWCNDFYAPYSANDAVDPGGPAKGDPFLQHVSRGGSWNRSPPACRVAYRIGISADGGSMSIGFRICAD